MLVVSKLQERGQRLPNLGVHVVVDLDRKLALILPHAHIFHRLCQHLLDLKLAVALRPLVQREIVLLLEPANRLTCPALSPLTHR